MPRSAASQAEALARERESDDEGSSPGSAEPRHSQYSVMPSPFIQNQNGSPADVDVDMVVDDATVKDETDDDRDLIITPAVEPSRVRLDEADALDDDDDDGTFWNALSPAENAHINGLHALVAVVQQQKQQQETARAAGSSTARARAMAASKATERLDDGPARADTGMKLDNAPSPVPPSAKGVFVAAEHDEQPQHEAAAATVPAEAPEPLAGNPIASPSRKRRREASSPPIQYMHELKEDEAPAAKRQKMDEPAVALAPEPASTNQAAEPARQGRKSAPSALPARAIGTPTPTPGRRIPRASLAVMSTQATGSPAPERAAPAAPPATAAPKGGEPAPSAGPPQASTAPRPAATAGAAPPKSTVAAKAPQSHSLADEIGDLARQYGVHRETIKHIMFCICAKGDMVNLAHLVKWFSPTHRPAEGTREYDELRKLAHDQVWTLREDTIVLEGSDSALEQLACKRGLAAIKKRRHFLQRAKITSVGLLRKDLYMLS